VRRDELLQSAGLKEACEILFGDEAEIRLQEYVDSVFIINLTAVSPDGELLFFSCPKKSNQKKRHP